MAAIQPISKIVNKQTKIMSRSFKRMSDIGAKNGEDIFDVIEPDDMDRYGLLTVNYYYFFFLFDSVLRPFQAFSLISRRINR